MSLFKSSTLTRALGHTPAEPHHITNLEGIGPQLADRTERHYHELLNTWKKYGENDYIFASLKLLAPPDQLNEQQVLACIKEDPYQLRFVRGINFKRADTIARMNYGIHPDDERRHEAGNQAALESRGGTLPMWQFRKERERFELNNREHELNGVIIDHGNAWLPEELQAEKDLAALFQDVLTSSKDLQLPDLDQLTAQYGSLDLGPLNTDQLTAVATATSGTRIMALTGGAGTGKTTVTAAIAKVAKHQKKTMRVMAFAGKAAQRSSEAMTEAGVNWIECSTIHRALGLRGPGHKNHDKLPEDIIILDEASMLPNWLLAAVVTALRPEATLVLVGDPNQLPPIGHGTPFQDYLALGLPHVHLEQNYRQAGQVSIHQFAEAIRQQNPNLYQPAETGVHTSFAIDPAAAEAEFDQIISDASQLSLHDWQLVTWRNSDRHELNQYVQKRLNPNGYPLFDYRLWGITDEYGRDVNAIVSVGDKILITDNDYDHEVYNGQTGIITGHAPDGISIQFDSGATRHIPLDDARDLMQLGYAVTVHKAQGSGWETVILYQPLPVKFSPRRFYYTSVTRAKNNVVLFTTLTQRAFWSNVQQADNDPDSTLIQRVHDAR